MICDCRDWKSNIDKFNNFVYCPWCGEVLRQPDIVVVDKRDYWRPVQLSKNARNIMKTAIRGY
jgi:hypothetical protein